MKKLLAYFLSLAMIMSLIVFPASYSVSAATNVQYEFYVSSSGSDSNEGTESSPFLTVTKAQTELAALEIDGTAVNGTIFVSGTVDFAGGIAHKGVHTIKGVSGTTPVVRSCKSVQIGGDKKYAVAIIQGPMIFDSVGIPADSNTTRMVTNGYPVEINNCNIGSASSQMLYIGNYDNEQSGKVIVKDWANEAKFLDPYIAAFGPDGTLNTSPGCNVVFDGGIKYVNLGRSGFTSTFNGDVNITFNSGTTAVNTYVEGTNTLNGALQMIFNNGVTIGSKDAIKNVTAASGVWRLFGTEGSFVETTETAGTFKVPEGYTAIATNQNSGAKFTSNGGYLTLPAGTYDFECETEVDTVYVSANGSDSNDGLTPETSLATINKAQEMLVASSSKKKTIMVTGTVDFDGGIEHRDMIEIVGMDNTAKLTPTGNVWVESLNDRCTLFNGPTTLKSIKFSVINKKIVTNGYPVEFINCGAVGNFMIYFGNCNSEAREKIVVKDWDSTFYFDPYIASYGPNSSSNTSLGCDIVFDGGVKFVNLGIKNKTSTFDGDVNITFNHAPQTVSTYKAGTNILNGALQMVFNNGVTVSSTDGMKDVTAAGGVWRLFGTEGSFVETTETAGTFKIPNGYTATATNRSTGEQIGSVNGLLVLSAGEYDVECGTNFDTVYVSENGDDSNDGLSPETPVATINKAQELLVISSSEKKTIMVTGTVNFDGGISHTDMIEIVGQDETATLVPNGEVWSEPLNNRCTLFNGPTTFKSISFTNAKFMITNGFEVKLIDCKTPGLEESTQFYVGQTVDKSEKDVFTISNYTESTKDDYIDLYFSTFGYESGGLDVFVPNATGLRYLTLGKSGKTTIYTGNVNFELNGDLPVREISTYIEGTVSINGAFQFICNNDVVSRLSASKNAFANIESKADVGLGSYFMYSSDKQYCGLSATDEAGTFRIKGGLAAKATNREDSSLVYYGVDTIVVDEPGVYDVEYFAIGDANLSGSVDIVDLIVVKKLLLNDGYKAQADLNVDGILSSDDLILMRKELLGMNESSVVTEAEAPAVMSFNQSGGYDSQAADKKNAIMNHTPATVNAATTYYVSSTDGDDSNDGLSPENPFKTIDKINTLSAGTSTSTVAVLFKKGDVFRTTSSLALKSYTTYSAYGTGEKPLISGSYKNFADHSYWTLENLASIWSADVDASAFDIANVVFNGEFSAVRKQSLSELEKDGDYFYDSAEHKLYLYLMNYNPGYYYDSVEVHSARKLAEATEAVDVTITDISFKFAAEHGINITKSTNLQINNCEVAWMGGVYYNAETGIRMGNGIEIWNDAKNATVSDCYIYQIFDAAVTIQGIKNDKYDGVLITNNLIEYSTYGFEFWGSSSVERMNDIVFTNNIVRFIGNGFSGRQRPDGSDAFISSSTFDMTTTAVQGFGCNGFVISNNVFDCGNAYYLSGRKVVGEHINFSGNTYYQKPGCSRMVRRLSGDEISVEVIAIDLQSFTNGIRQFDNTGTVNWITD